jgi:general secretion pathway protein J
MNRGSGLTLVELLVVIIITALIATLMMQGIGQGLGMLQRVNRDQGHAYRELMGREWLRQTLAAAVANTLDSDEFLGTAQGLSLRTFRPLLGPEGISTAISWTVQDDGLLQYQEQDQLIRLDPGSEILRIEYQDDAAEWHSRWPQDEKRQLPERVRFVTARDDPVEIGVLTRRLPFQHDDEAAYDEE